MEDKLRDDKTLSSFFVNPYIFIFIKSSVGWGSAARSHLRNLGYGVLATPKEKFRKVKLLLLHEYICGVSTLR